MPDEEALTPLAKKRLEAIQMMEELGSGFYLAMHDMEIRGAGEVLGESQSGEMQEIGFNLYNDMLNMAIRALKKGKEPDLTQPFEVTTEINLHTPALLPNDYCSDVHERLTLYKRLANCGSEDELETLHEELVDRFGIPPEQTQVLLDSHRLRILGKPLGVARIDATGETVQLQFTEKPPLDPGRMMALMQKNNWKLMGPNRLRASAKGETPSARADAARRILETLQQAVAV